MPAVRPRSGTWNSRTPSRAGSRSGTPIHSMYEVMPGDMTSGSRSINAGDFDATPSKRKSTLAPTQEQDEALSRQVSREMMTKGKERA